MFTDRTIWQIKLFKTANIHCKPTCARAHAKKKEQYFAKYFFLT